MDQLIDLQDSRLLALEQEFEVELQTLQKVKLSLRWPSPSVAMLPLFGKGRMGVERKRAAQIQLTRMNIPDTSTPLVVPAMTTSIQHQEFAEERKHVVRQHAAEVQELSDIIAAVEVRSLMFSQSMSGCGRSTLSRSKMHVLGNH